MLLCALILYLATLDNGFQPEELRGGDLITHQYAQVQARPGNAPGYPLYTMGGWLWFHGWRWLQGLWGQSLPNPIPTLSSYSLLWALVSLWFFYQMIAQTWENNRERASFYKQRDKDFPFLWPHPSASSPCPLRYREAVDGKSSSEKPYKQPQRTGLTGTHLHSLPEKAGGYSHGTLLFPWLLGAFYAVTYFFWFYATTTEQYTSAIAQTLAIVYFYIQFQKALDPSDNIVGQSPRATQYVILLAFLCGLSLAHMLTVAFIVPPLVAVIVWQAPWLLRSAHALLGSILAAALPLVSYVYVYIRGGGHPDWWGEGEWATPNEWFWSFVSTAQGRDELARGFEPWCGPWAGGFPDGMWHELSLPILLLGLIGIAYLGKRMAALFYGTLVIYLIFCWMYRCGNWFQVILPVYPLILLGLVPLMVRFRGWAKGRPSWIAYAPYVLLVVAIFWRVNASWPQVNSQNRIEDTAFDGVAHLLDDSLPPGVALFGALDNALALQYLNQIWGIRPDLEIVDHKEARRRIDNGQYVLVTYESAPQLLGEMRAETTIGLWSVSPKWVAVQDVNFIDEDSYGDPAVLLNQQIEPGVELVGYTVLPPSTSPVLSEFGNASPTLDLMLYWRLDNPQAETAQSEPAQSEPAQSEPAQWPEGLSISVRPTSGGTFFPLVAIDPAASPEAIIQQDQARPMQGLEPISRIPTGQVFGDGYSLLLPARGSGDEDSGDEDSGDGAQVDGIMVILYRAVEGGFTNVAEVRLSVQ